MVIAINSWYNQWYYTVLLIERLAIMQCLRQVRDQTKRPWNEAKGRWKCLAVHLPTLHGGLLAIQKSNKTVELIVLVVFINPWNCQVSDQVPTCVMLSSSEDSINESLRYCFNCDKVCEVSFEHCMEKLQRSIFHKSINPCKAVDVWVLTEIAPWGMTSKIQGCISLSGFPRETAH